MIGITASTALMVETFLAQSTFRCSAMNAHIQHTYCVERQSAEVASEFGWGTGRAKTPADAFCASGECAQGVAVKLQTRRAKSRASAAPTQSRGTRRAPAHAGSPRRSERAPRP